MSSSFARRSLFAAASMLALGFGASTSQAVDVYTIKFSDSDSSLLKFSTENPEVVTEIPLSGEILDSIDARPANGQLYGYASFSNTYYLINPTSGSMTAVSAASAGPGASTFANGIDWNPTIDRLRLVSEADENIVFNPNTGTTTAATPLFYIPSDVNAGKNPAIVDNAYTNSFAGATSTEQFAIDFTLNSLARLNNNTGELSTVAPLTLNGEELDIDNFSGFDIYRTAAGNVGYLHAFDAATQTDRLYTVNLASGAATLVGIVNDADLGLAYSLAVVPEPTSLVALSALGMLGLRRRRD